jgi:hypothetical protein
VLLNRAALRVTRVIGTRGNAGVELAAEEPVSVAVAARPASGNFRPNPALGGPFRGVVRVTVDRAAGSMSGPVQAGGRVALEAGQSVGGQYARVGLDGELSVDAGPTQVALYGRAGLGSSRLPMDRGFVLGGRGTLPGYAFRAWGGRRMALGRVEWRLPVPFVALPLGAFGTTGNRAVLAPFVAAGWTGEAIPGGGVSAGATLELFHRLLKVEVGTSLRQWRAVFAVDLRRDLWPIL